MSGVVNRVKDRAKRLLRPKDQESTTETTIVTQPEVEDFPPREEGMEYNERLDVRGIIYDNWLNLNRNKVTGYYDFSKWRREDTFLDDVKNLVDDMEILKSEDNVKDWPTEEFKKDIIKAEYEADEVEIGRAMKRACLRFIRRRKMGPPEKSQPSKYEPDEIRLMRREYSESDDGDDLDGDWDKEDGDFGLAEDDAPYT